MHDQLDLFESAMEKAVVGAGNVGKEDVNLEPKKPQPIQYAQKKLTTRQWRLLDLIKINSIVERRKTTQKEICEKISDYEWNDNPKTHDHCVMIWNDIKDINLSYETDKLIISDNFEYWLGNEQETKTFIDKLWKDLEPRLVRYWAYLKKVARDGQGQLLSRRLDPIDENSSARAFIESYGKERISED